MEETLTLNPLDAGTEIRSAFVRYLNSTYSPRDQRLRQELQEALADKFRLTQGPYVQAAPPYAKAKSLKDLVADNVLNSEILRLTESAFPTDRALYHHQEEAIRKLCQGRNLIISTGTGSGKTECFLFPILHYLLEEAEAGTLSDPGVRALLLYPMNALANDQVKRLRQVFAPFPDITFGRFVGDTPNDAKTALDTFKARFGDEPEPNELIARDQMRDRPPHILLTNYAMLEYLLLRPADTSLFDGPTGRHWRFIVLDEVHVYDGAQGAEVAMLLRRVRDRVNESERGRIQFVGTSATLGSGESAYPALAEYAKLLFDEEVEYLEGDSSRQDIVPPRRETLVTHASSWTLAPEQVEPLRDQVLIGAAVSEISALLAGCGAPQPGATVSVSSYLGEALRCEATVVRLQARLEGGSVDFGDLASDLYGGADAGLRLTALIDLCVRARRFDSDAPLIPARYHFLIRALEGAFICLSPAHPSGEPRLLLSRHARCPGCAIVRRESQMFEFGVCRRCGAGYLLGVLREEDGLERLQTAGPFEADLRYLLIDHPDEQEDEDEAAVVDDESAAVEVDDRLLCTHCGALTEGASSACDCDQAYGVRVLDAHPTRRGVPLRRCLGCSGRSNASIVSRFLTGQDAPVAVIATALYQALPPSSDPAAAAKIGHGRKLLSFSDSRQDAAFFAPYLDRTYSRAVERRLIWEVVARLASDHPRFEDLVIPIRKAAERAQVLDEDDGAKRNADRVRAWLMREVLAVDRRQSLDGVGLAEITLAIPNGCQVPPALTDLGFTESEVFDLIRVLLDTVRMQAAVHLPEGVDITDQMFAPRNVVTSMRSLGRAPGVLAWNPVRGLNRRVDYLAKVFERRGISVPPMEVLAAIWSNWLTAPQSPWLKVLVSRSDRREGIVFALDPGWTCFLASEQGHRPFRCDSCRQVWWRSISGVCPTYRCLGSLEPVGDALSASDDHYLRLYTSMKPLGLRVEEHTGQLGSEYAGRLQEQFLSGDLNALSCSTTFELGVDVGEVQAVLMRNVPPSPANYVQRAGRAGRRSGAAALVVTFAQRRNHDLHYFDNPRAMIDGYVTAPIVSLQNPQIVRRHVHAIAFAAFERRHVEAGGEWHRTVESFFLPPDGDGAAPIDTFIHWLESRPAELGRAVARTVPRHLADEIGVEDWSWVDALIAENDQVENYGWLARASAEVRGDLDDLHDEINQIQGRIKEATDSKQDVRARNLTGYLGALLAVRRTLAGRRLLDFLAQRVVLPKYGFPVDVVTLDVWRQGDKTAGQLDLSRDLRLGITDYAPGSRVVADKALWETIGLRIPAGRALIDSVWAICSDCGAFRAHRGSEAGACPICSSVDVRSSRQFVIPMFGFLGQRCEDKPGEARPPKAGSSEFHFSDYASDAPAFEGVPLGRHTAEVRFSRQGQITVINSGPAGRGFAICRSCGHTEPVPQVRQTNKKDLVHQRPTVRGGECSSMQSNRHLGHQYLTDVVEIRLPVAMNTEEARSTMYALLGAMNAIGISQGDVDGTLRSAGVGVSPSIVLFDAVPGGAGHARRIVENLDELVRRGLDVVANCECGEESSCYGCLRTYSNQIHHESLVRGHAKRILEHFV
jgi:hypothetical protein